MHYFDWQFLVCENLRFKIIYSSFSGTDQAWDWIHCIVTWHNRVRSQTEERNLIRHCILCWSVCCACSYQRTSAFAWGNWKSWTKCITSVKQPSWKPVSKIWNLLHDINLHIFWLLLFFLRKVFAEKVFIGYQYCCLTYFLLYFFKGDAIRGWKIPDGSWKIWFSFKSMATADFEWILLLWTNIYIYIYMNCNIPKGTCHKFPKNNYINKNQ